MTGLRTRVALASALVLVSGGTAFAASCSDLSYARNSIYKAAGYCFKTAEQIRNFGNEGCRFDNQADVPLSENDRAQVGAILRDERATGCR